MAKLLSLCALVGVFAPHGGKGSAVRAGYAPRPAPVQYRSLQAASNIIWISPLDSDAEELQVRDLDSRDVVATRSLFKESFYDAVIREMDRATAKKREYRKSSSSFAIICGCSFSRRKCRG